MNILWIDTASQSCSIAIGNSYRLFGFESLPVKQGQAETIGFVMQNIFKASRLKPIDMQKIVVSQGPGSFTAVRIGLSVARMFAQVLDIPCLGISNFALMWHQLCYQKAQFILEEYNALSIHSFRKTPFFQTLNNKELSNEPSIASKENIKAKNIKKVIMDSEKDKDFWESFSIETSKLNPIADYNDKGDFLHYLIKQYISVSDAQAHPAVPLYIRDADAKISSQHTKTIKG